MFNESYCRSHSLLLLNERAELVNERVRLFSDSNRKRKCSGAFLHVCRFSTVPAKRSRKCVVMSLWGGFIATISWILFGKWMSLLNVRSWVLVIEVLAREPSVISALAVLTQKLMFCMKYTLNCVNRRTAMKEQPQYACTVEYRIVHMFNNN